MKLATATRSGFAQYWRCEGRASRSEYWYWTLFTVLVSVPCWAIDQFVMHAPPVVNGMGALELLANVVLLMPSFTVMIRRLHDVNRSGYWWLVGFTIVGLIPLLYWLIKRGTLGENRFGPDPLA